MFILFGSLFIVVVIMVTIIEFILESIAGKPVGYELLIITAPIGGILGWNWNKIYYIAGKVIKNEN